MPRIVVFNQVSLDGYFSDVDGDMSWAHEGDDDAEWNAFVAGNASAGGTLMFGRITYELMASFWPTPMALETMPAVAERMNGMPKLVVSRSLGKATWKNTTVVKGDLAVEVAKMKKGPGKDITILGSGSVVSQLAQKGLIDEFKIVVKPVVLGRGRTVFEDVEEKLHLKLTSTRAFGNGSVLLCYAPA